MENKESNCYTKNGYKNRQDYLKSLAAEYDLDLKTVLVLADMLGPSEDFDGLVSGLQDYVE
ncbi:hypothetical protein FACS189447_08680 [Spirochaetia bacterium]|nr:hypothetical protein FACS189447_08680 [Spirochaetia bacterium]